MSSDAQDIAVARYLKQEGLVTAEQLQHALQAQAKAVEGGKPISLAAALLQIGAITPGQKEVLERRLKGEGKKGTQQILHYKLKKKLGEGGMGAVYLAEDARDGKRVAIKVLPRKHAADPEFMKRFKREAEAACRLDHPNIVRAFEAGEDVGYHFYVMEYCEGEPLDRALKRTGLFSWHRAFEIVRDVAKGLQFAHGQGFIHRDIKPANIFMTAAGVPKILDLGLTKKIDESQLSFQTMSGAVVGTPHYISPEQAKSDKSIDGRTDIYSVGATLYHLLTGEPPFGGTTLYEILSKHVNAELPNPQDIVEDIPEGVVHVLRKMMAKAVNDRYADCGELLKDVELVLQGKSPESAALGADRSSVAQLRKAAQGARRKRAGTYRVPMAKKPRSHAALLWGGVGVAAVLVLIIAVALGSGGSSSERLPTTDTAVAPPKPEPPKPRPTTPLENREDVAKNKLDDLLKSLDGPPPAENARRMGELERFIAENAGTFAASTAQGILKDLRKDGVPPGAKPVDHAWIAEVQELPPEEQVKSVTEMLKARNPGYQGTVDFKAPDGTVREVFIRATGLSDIAPLRALKGLKWLHCSGYYDPTTGRNTHLPLSDLSPLRDLKLEQFYASVTNVRDLEPLRAMPLTVLQVSATSVTDLRPLTGMKLVHFECVATKVSDIGPLRGMPLRILDLRHTAVSDLSPLMDTRLEELGCDEDALRNASFLRNVPTLRLLNGVPVAGFWKKYDATASPPPVAAQPGSAAPTKLAGFANPLPALWKGIVENKGKLKGQVIPLERQGFDGATSKVKDVTDKELVVEMFPKVGGSAELREQPETLDERVIIDLLWKAVGDPTPEMRKSIALLYAERGKFDEARRELERAKAAGADVADLARVIGEKSKVYAPATSAAVTPPPTLKVELGGGVTMDLIHIKPGTFTMGGKEAPRQSWQVDDQPEHRVTLTRGFYLGKYEVTRAQFSAFVIATGHVTNAEKEGKVWGYRRDRTQGEIVGASWRNPVVFTQTDEHPVTCVDWEDIEAFCKWLSKRARRTVRLPSEAEWEYSCRAGTATRWSWGDNKSLAGNYAWIHENSQWQTHAVGQKNPNPWGLYDMHGNVWEWCSDWHGPYLAEAAVDPKGPRTGNRRILRGGCWCYDLCDSSVRHTSDPMPPRPAVGFRVVVEEPEVQTSAPPRPSHVPPDAKEFNGHWYKLIEEKQTWHEAKKRCEELGGHLVTISSAEENTSVRSHLKGEGAWLGLTDESEVGSWKWVTGEASSFMNGALGEPEGGKGTQRHVRMLPTQDAKWDNEYGHLKSSWPAATLVDETGWRPRGLPTDAADHWYAKSDLKSGVGA